VRLRIPKRGGNLSLLPPLERSALPCFAASAPLSALAVVQSSNTPRGSLFASRASPAPLSASLFSHPSSRGLEAPESVATGTALAWKPAWKREMPRGGGGRPQVRVGSDTLMKKCGELRLMNARVAHGCCSPSERLDARPEQQQQDSAAGIRRQLKEQLKELGFKEQVISAVLLHESGGSISLPEAIDLCLAHNDFQVACDHFYPRGLRPTPAS
jgi:hypothetical protein